MYWHWFYTKNDSNNADFFMLPNFDFVTTKYRHRESNPDQLVQNQLYWPLEPIILPLEYNGCKKQTHNLAKLNLVKIFLK